MKKTPPHSYDPVRVGIAVAVLAAVTILTLSVVAALTSSR